MAASLVAAFRTISLRRVSRNESIPAAQGVASEQREWQDHRETTESASEQREQQDSYTETSESASVLPPVPGSLPQVGLEDDAGSQSSSRGPRKVLKSSDPGTPPPPPRRSSASSSPNSLKDSGFSSNSPLSSSVSARKKNRRRSSIGYDNDKKSCPHYKRRSSLIAPCCNELVACRFCHDEFHETKSPLLTRKKMAEGNVSSIPMSEVIHTINRHDVKLVVCMECGHEQPPAQDCELCGVCFGEYFCKVCNLFDDDLSKGQFHCDKCGICRVGGRENYFHCDTCGCCYSNCLKDNHKCVERSMHQNCPVCQEFLFSSVKGGIVMECGHVIHGECYDALLEAQIAKCPLCNKSILSQDGRNHVNEALRQAVVETPMPEEFRDLDVKILCNDCQTRGEAKFHVVGMECSTCGSFNTSQIR